MKNPDDTSSDEEMQHMFRKQSRLPQIKKKRKKVVK